MVEKKAYSEAVDTGKYNKTTGLLGKYDNVRRFWEDQLSGIFLRPALNELVKNKTDRLERIRILDLGCGSGDAYDLIMNIYTKDPGIYDYITGAITHENLQEYVGLDVNEDLLEQARQYWAGNAKLRFVTGDLSQGLPESSVGNEAFDMYYTSYGTLAHFTDEVNTRLIADIFKHASNGALFVGDWLGRYSYEWQDLWHHSANEEYFMDYRISYIYEKDERNNADIASFPLRLMTRDEIMKIINKASDRSGVKVVPVCFYDRSIFVGRHLETGDYNRYCPPMRSRVNSLFESYMRTDLSSIKFDYVPRQGFDHLNNFFEMYFMSCNALVDYTISLLSQYESESGLIKSEPEIKSYFPEPLKEVMRTMRKVVEGVGSLKYGEVRANFIEPQLGYALRELEIKLQPGTGVGHSLAGIFRIEK